MAAAAEDVETVLVDRLLEEATPMVAKLMPTVVVRWEHN